MFMETARDSKKGTYVHASLFVQQGNFQGYVNKLSSRLRTEQQHDYD